MRVSEASRLNLDDYDPRARTLRIELTKFFKTRQIPLPRRTCTLLNQYLVQRHQLGGEAGESLPLFVSALGSRVHRVTFETSFKQLLCSLDLYRPRQRQGCTVFGSTNLHALRHSFAVRTLERWQRAGADVERLLPLLSGYMGHVHVRYTKHYLHLTPFLRQLCSDRFAEMALPHIDRLDTHTEPEDA